MAYTFYSGIVSWAPFVPIMMKPLRKLKADN
jgi:hypothetical protein